METSENDKEMGAVGEGRELGGAEIAKNGIADGRSDGAEAAKRIYGQLAAAAGKFAYGVSYYAAFAAAFTAVVAREALSETMREGARAGGEAAEKALKRMREARMESREGEAGNPVAPEMA